MNIVLFGANGPTGRRVAQQALDESHTVTAVTRHPEHFPLQHARLRVLQGDVFDRAAVEQAVAGHDAVLSALGVPFSRQPITVYSQGVAHIIQAMRRCGIQRLVCVSSSALDPRTRDQDTGGGVIFEKIIKPLIINNLGRTLYADMQRMEALVMESQLDWTILRPAGLFDTPAVTKYQIGESSTHARYTSRADLADSIVRQLGTSQFVRKTATVATVTTAPSMAQMIFREAFQQRPS